MRTLGLTPSILTLGLLLAGCPGGGTGDDVGDDATTGDGDTTGESGDGDGESTGSAGTTDDAETTDADTTTDAETTDADTTTDAETTDAETTSDTTDTGTTDTTDTTGGDGDCGGELLGVCDAEPASDGFNIDSLSITGDCLEVDVNYGGGCQDHTFTSCWDMSFAESNPVQTWLWIDHDAMNDPCDAIVQDTWIIDLTALKQAWQAAYQSQTGTIIIHVGGESIQYDF